MSVAAQRLAAPRDFRGAFRTDVAARAAYSESAGIAQAWPRAVAVPEDADAVVTLVQWANAVRQPLIARGSGSSMAGGATGDGVIVDLSRLREVGSITRREATIAPGIADHATHTVVLGPGVLCGELERLAASHGLRFPVDPSSSAFCTVGGMAATNAAGPHTLSAGAMRPWVMGLECVFADGTRAWVRRGAPPCDLPVPHRLSAWRNAPDATPGVRSAAVRKEASGYGVAPWRDSHELVDLLVGSEGTLALFTAIEVALEPQPGASATVLAAFATLEAATAGATEARSHGAATCELLDRTLLDLARSGSQAVPVTPDTEAVLLIGVERERADLVQVAAATLAESLRAVGATHVVLGLSPDEEDALWALRHAASPMLAALDPAMASVQVIEDGCVPPERLADYVRGVRAALVRRRFPGVIFGHAGDAHVHVNPLVDLREPDWRERLEALVDDVVSLTASMGGTLSGEHGDGRLRPSLNARVHGHAAMAAWAAIKRAADPDDRLNPGVIVPIAGQHALDRIKYDPSLPALPAAARSALDLVSSTRAYGRSRLELVDASAGR